MMHKTIRSECIVSAEKKQRATKYLMGGTTMEIAKSNRSIQESHYIYIMFRINNLEIVITTY